MAEPELVAECVAAMRQAVAIPVTVKTRIGIDELDSYEHLAYFVQTVAAAGCATIIIHARKAWLKGLSPKENREIPPLRYDVALQIKQDFPRLEIVLNGGILTLDECLAHVRDFDGVMLGRAAYHNPYCLAEADRVLFGDGHTILNRHEVLEAYLPYVEQELAQGARLQGISRHILGLFHGEPGGRLWRRHVSENAVRPGAGLDVLKAAAALAV
jgi:tRNA-dihydrouridine synthase A